MAEYEVWATNDSEAWTQCLLETDSRDEAKNKAQDILDRGRFRYVAIDHRKKTIWSNDPDTPAVNE